MIVEDNKNKRNGMGTRRNTTRGKSSIEMVGSRIPPYSIDAEVAVLGAMLLDKVAISKVQEVLHPESFYDEKNRLIFEAITKIYEPGIGVDLVTLSEQLKKNEWLERVGGTYYLTELLSNTPTAANVEHYAHIVQEKYLKRQLIDVSGRIIERCYDESTDAIEEIDQAETDIFRIAEQRIHKTYKPISDLAHQTYSLIEHLKEHSAHGLSGVPSGYVELDKILGGFQNSDLIILAGRPSMGKTALALSLARNAAKEYKKTVAFFSIEMSSLQLVVRLISAEAKIDQQKIRTGKINDKELRQIVKTLGKLSETNMIIDDSPMLTISELRAKCRRLKIEHKIDMVILDYLQLMMPPKAESREREISILSRSLKQLAKELNIPIMALAQLNRSVETRSDKRPILSDLRESGSIEQDADVVMFVNRPDYYGIQFYDDKRPTEGTAEVIVGKQRNGPTDTARLAYIKDFARFENLSWDDLPPGVEINESDNGAGF
jgi:replicative DNA helicase